MLFFRLAGLVLAVNLGAAATPDYQVKAAYLYNFAKFVEWPAGSSPVRICVMGKDPFGGTLDETVAGRSVNGRPLEARKLPEGGEPGGCQVIFFSEADTEKPEAALRAAEKAGALTVGESRAFQDGGGMIRFLEEGGKVRFDINLEAVKRARLQVSSQLLRVARSVHGR